ncbi:hypothetical protein H6P81_008190 [Aristolochia fimbriata]|uniref:DM2 domain-containing protein n=1 Tax=Aristolochia fimbriata TaxID=158543 RepID=A0AAV7F3K7_ARIFI|nr:hypothetical protein H6P81_008190 [Aristolochia fimbriata]
MATNNNSQLRNPTVPSPLGNPAMVPSAMTMNQLSHLRPPSQTQTPGISHFQTQFQSTLQVQAQYQAQMQAQAQSLGHNQNAGLASSPSPSSSTPGTAEPLVDAALARKKIDIQESLKNPPCIQKTLRIYVFNTYANQTRTIPEKPNSEPPSWSLKIIGRILEDSVDADSAGGIPKPSPSYPKFSSFFKRITITLDPMLYPDNPTIIWEHARSPALHEGFEIKRKGDKEFVANIRLEMNYVPEKFKLSPPLMEVLGIEVDTRPRIVAAIWHYVKAKKLQNPSDPSYFACDPPLRKVFGEEKVKFSHVSQKISSHLSPPQPIHLEHKIKLSGNQPAANPCYDVVVDIPFPIQREMSAFLANTEKHKEIVACDDAICAAIKKIHEHRRRRAFFLGFSQSPVEFINVLIASQSRDLKLVAGEASRNAEKERRADFYNQPWVEDAVIRYLNRKPAGGNDAPGSTFSL